MSVDLTSRLRELEDELFAVVGHNFNLRSTQQLSQVLFDEMKFPTRGLRRPPPATTARPSMCWRR
jgi:DNA polymerase-1